MHPQHMFYPSGAKDQWHTYCLWTVILTQVCVSDRYSKDKMQGFSNTADLYKD